MAMCVCMAVENDVHEFLLLCLCLRLRIFWLLIEFMKFYSMSYWFTYCKVWTATNESIVTMRMTHVISFHRTWIWIRCSRRIWKHFKEEHIVINFVDEYR